MENQVKILCVDDEKNVLRSLKRLFLDDNYIIYTALSAKEGLEILTSIKDVQIVVSDYRMPKMNGVEFLREVYKNWPDTVRIVLSGFADTTAVVEAINEGHIYKFIPKPWNDEELKLVILEGIEGYFLKKKNFQLLHELKSSNEKLRKINEALKGSAQEIVHAILQKQGHNINHNIFTSLPFGVIAIDSKGEIVLSNDNASKILGASESEVLVHPWSVALPEIFHPLVEKLMKKGELSESWHVDGQRGWIKGNKFHLENQDGFFLIFDREDRLHD